MVGAIVLCWLGATLWLGCTPRERYRVLSFFFDGVPDPDAVAALRSAQGGGTRQAPLFFVHKPYAEQNCGACHSTENLPAMMPAGEVLAPQCLTCHASVLQQYPIIHGPVAADACLWCHDPHESQYRHLLRRAAPPLCTQCHEPDLLSSHVPEHTSLSTSCLDCHSGHGGSERGFLLPGVFPASRPATTAASGGPS